MRHKLAICLPCNRLADRGEVDAQMGKTNALFDLKAEPDHGLQVRARSHQQVKASLQASNYQAITFIYITRNQVVAI